MNTYTVLDHEGSVMYTGLSAEAAATELLNYEGMFFEIRPEEDGKGFCLWTSLVSRNAGGNGYRLVKSFIFSLAETLEAAKEEIALEVIAMDAGNGPRAVLEKRARRKKAKA